MRFSILRPAAAIAAGLLTAAGVVTIGAIPASAATIGSYTPNAGIPAAPTSPDKVVDTSGSVDDNCGAGLTGGTETVYSTIGAAVSAATAGQTIYVCAGTYAETVSPTVNNLTIDGAQWSATAVGRAAVPESSITPALNDSAVVYGGAAVTGAINGFSLSGTTSATDEVDGIEALSSSDNGFTWQNNAISDFTVGIHFEASGAGPTSTLIHGNSFVNNTNDPSDGDSGQGIFISNGPGNNVTISNNSFSGDNSSGGDSDDINTTGAGTPPPNIQTGLVVTGNSSTGAGNFLVLFETNGASITDNTVTGNTSSAFYIGGENTNDTFTGNTISAGSGPNAKGFRFTNNAAFNYGTSTDLTVQNNTISGQVDGIEGASSYNGTVINGNTISGSSNDGILMDAGAVGYSITNNTVSGSTLDDIQDLTTGTETGETGNFYLNNKGTTASPPLTLTANPVFTNDLPPLNLAPGATYAYTFAATGTPTPTYALVGAPSFLSINAATGAVTGTPPAATTTFSYSVSATNGVNPVAIAGPFTVSVSTTSTSFSILINGSSATAVVPGVAATLTESGIPATAAGTVTFSDSASTVCTVALTGLAGEATSCTTPTTLVIGSYTIGADFTDTDGVFANSTSSDTVILNVGAAPPTGGGTTTPPPGGGTTPTVTGAYDLVGSDGGVFVFGQPGTGFYGSLPGQNIHVNNIVGIVPTLDGKGYFLVGSDGGVFTFGDAVFYGSLPGQKIHVNNIEGIVPTADDKGYFLVGRDGGVFTFGDAPFENSLPGQNVHVNNITGIAATPDDKGYWLVASSGLVYAFGDAKNLGNASTGPIVSITSTLDGGGYWLTSSNGSVDTFGDAGFYNSLPGIGVPVSNIVSLVPSPDGQGYLLIGSDGGIFAFGDATFPGSLPGQNVRVNNIVGAVPVV